MRSYSTKFTLRNTYSYDEFLSLLKQFHHDAFSNQLEQVYHFPQLSVIAVSINNHHQMTEYIYEYKHNILSIKGRHIHGTLDIIDYLINNALIEDDLLPIKETGISMSFHYFKKNIEPQIYQNNFSLPIIYISRNINKELPVDCQFLSKELKGLVQIIEEKTFYKHRKSVPYKGRIDIYYKNNEHKSYFPFANETKHDLTHRIYQQIMLYLQQQEFDFPFQFQALKELYIDQLKTNIQNKEKESFIQIEKESQKLQAEKEKLLIKIQEIEKEIYLLKEQNNQYNSLLDNQTLLIPKGQIEDYYQDEQKEIILSILKDEIKNTPQLYSSKEREMIKNIIDQNPSSGSRDYYLEQILQILLSRKKINKGTIEGLKRYGVFIENNKNKHLIAKFYNNSRYFTTLSSTPSDYNASKQGYRQVRKIFF